MLQSSLPLMLAMRMEEWPLDTPLWRRHGGVFGVAGSQHAGNVWILVVVSGLAAGVAILVCGGELWRLHSGCTWPLPGRSFPIGFLVSAPAVVATLSFAQVVLQNHMLVPFLLQNIYEALAAWFLLQLFLDFLGRTSKELMFSFEEADPQRIWSAPPFCCLAVLPGSRPRVANAWDLLAMKVLVLQCVVVYLIIALLEALHEQQGRPLSSTVIFVQRLPSLVGMLFGIFALLRAGHSHLEGRRCHRKFWLLKGFLVVQLLSRRLILSAGHGSDHARATACTASALLALPFALVTRLAYVPDDLDAPPAGAAGSLGAPERGLAKPGA
mmetsp:Transcript_94400/g.294022  ORF Transcript_94400/g.294022 Transcript_94400/m.294022 type:complete len:326 (+) Transcript_94400:82-1059(+)